MSRRGSKPCPMSTVKMGGISMSFEISNCLGLKIRDSRVVVSSRDVAKAFSKRHDHVLRDINNLPCSQEFRLPNFGAVYKTSPDGSRIGTSVEEIFMTRDGFTLLAMGYTGEKAMRFKELFIAEFNRMEREMKVAGEDFRIPKSLSEALRLAAEIEERRVLLEERNRTLEPKALAWDATCGEGSEMSIQAVAKELARFGTGPRKLFDLLAKRKVIYRLDGSWVPMQRYIDSGHFRVKRVTMDLGAQRQKSYCKTLVTPKGRDLIARVLADQALSVFAGVR